LRKKKYKDVDVFFMNLNKINKRLEALEESRKDKKQRPPFSTLERVNEGILTPEEGLELLQDGNEAFCKMQTIIIESGVKHGKLPRKRKSVRYDLYE
jgi:hypothetical protein